MSFSEHGVNISCCIVSYDCLTSLADTHAKQDVLSKQCKNYKL